MTHDKLKELERLSERWANDCPTQAEWVDVGRDVMDMLPDVIQALKEREWLMANLDYSVNLAVATATEKLTAERDAALSDLKMKNEWLHEWKRTAEALKESVPAANRLCRELEQVKAERDAALKALDAANAKCADLQLTIDGLNVGYHADSEWEPVVEALRRIYNYPVHSEPVGGAMDMQDIAHDALAHAERITGGGK